jgi:hypothetical protein
MLKKILKVIVEKASDYSYTKNKQNISRRLEERALDSTCEYIEKTMSSVKPQKSVFEVLDYAIQATTIEGLVCEFGVFSGRSINHIASKISRTIHGFDSFEGLPEFWRDGFDKGAFEMNTLPRVLANVELHKGWFEHTLPQFIQDHSEIITLLHIDCDLYSSTKTVFEYLGNRIVRGTVIVFDEYFNYPFWQQGEFKAFQEFISDYNLQYRYLTYNLNHEQVAVIIE